jgi:hypothetical protein
VRYALAKAIAKNANARVRASAQLRGMTRHSELEDQNAIAVALEQRLHDLDPGVGAGGTVPTRFDGQSIIAKDAQGRCYKLQLEIKDDEADVPALDPSHLDHTNVISHERHCMYLQRRNETTREWIGHNSWGAVDPHPRISMDDPSPIRIRTVRVSRIELLRGSSVRNRHGRQHRLAQNFVVFSMAGDQAGADPVMEASENVSSECPEAEGLHAEELVLRPAPARARAPAPAPAPARAPARAPAPARASLFLSAEAALLGLEIGAWVPMEHLGETVHIQVVDYEATKVIFRYPDGKHRSVKRTVAATKAAVDAARRAAPRLCVSGAGTPRVNGFYMQDGLRNGKPLYRKIGDTDMRLFWEENLLGTDEWVIFPDELLMGRFYHNCPARADRTALPPTSGWLTCRGLGGDTEACTPPPTISFPTFDPRNCGTPIFRTKNGKWHDDKKRLPRGTRVTFEETLGWGVGVVQGFERNTFGANEYTVQFGTSRRTLKLRDMEYRIEIM